MEETLNEECGRPLEGQDDFGGSYEDALLEWSKLHCEHGVFEGKCADGKMFLRAYIGFDAETLYFTSSQLVGVVRETDFGDCPSACPASKYYGNLADVTCEVTEVLSACSGDTTFVEVGDFLPAAFADGQSIDDPC